MAAGRRSSPPARPQPPTLPRPLRCRLEDARGLPLRARTSPALGLDVALRSVSLPGDVLNRYVGEYKLANGFSIAVSTESKKLYALAQGDLEKIELTPESETKFFLKGPEIAIEFINEEGEVKYMFVNIQGGQKLTKVK